MITKSKKLSKLITIGPPPSETELELLAKQGFGTIVNLSTPGELDQVLSPEDEGKQVLELGLQYLHFPVSLSKLKPCQVQEFVDAVEGKPGPIYIHCRLGQRSGPFGIILYGLRRRLSPERALEKAEKLGITWGIPLLTDFVRKSLDVDPDVAALVQAPALQ